MLPPHNSSHSASRLFCLLRWYNHGYGPMHASTNAGFRAIVTRLQRTAPAKAVCNLLARWFLGALSRCVVWGALAASVVAVGVLCGRRCRLRCRLGWCTRRAFMACRGFVLVPVHVGVCCSGGLPARRCRLLCVVFPILGVCRYLQCACSVVPTCVPASLVLLLMPTVLSAWCSVDYIVLLLSM